MKKSKKQSHYNSPEAVFEDSFRADYWASIKSHDPQEVFDDSFIKDLSTNISYTNGDDKSDEDFSADLVSGNDEVEIDNEYTTCETQNKYPQNYADETKACLEDALSSSDIQDTGARYQKKPSNYMIAQHLFDTGDFMGLFNPNFQLYAYNQEFGFWQLIETSDEFRSLRCLIPKHFASSVSRNSLAEIYDWLFTKFHSQAYQITDDADKKGYLNFMNCAIDCTTGKVVDAGARKQMFFRHFLPFEYNIVEHTKYGKSRYMDFLHEMFGGDDFLVREILKLTAYICSGVRVAKIIVFFYGPSDTRKSTLLKLLRSILGEQWCSSVSFSQFGDEFAITQLLGKLLNTSGEISGTTRKRLDILKSLTGFDVTTTAFKTKNHFQFYSNAVLVFGCNVLPVTDVPQEFDAILKRSLIFPCNKIVKADDINPRIVNEILEDTDGIVSALVRGMQYLNEDNWTFKENEQMQQLKHQFEDENNSFGAFANQHLIEDCNGQISSSAISRRYKEYCTEAGIVALADNIWAQILKQRFPHAKPAHITEYNVLEKHRVRGYRGIRMIDDESEE